MNKRIPQSFIDDVLSRTDIIDIIERFIDFKKKSSSSYVALCPFHQEKTPSFSVSQTKQFYHCFGCGASGNAITFLIEYERLEFIEAIEFLAHEAGIQIPKEFSAIKTENTNENLYCLMEKVATFYKHQLQNNAKATAYLEQRGISSKTINHFSIGYAPAGWNNLTQQFGRNTIPSLVETGMMIEKNQNQYDRFRDRIMFPIRDRRGRVVAFGGRVLDDSLPKYLNSPETAIFHKSNELYGLYESGLISRQIPRLLVVEGYMDVASLSDNGINFAVATLGTATTANHISNLFRRTNEIIFSFDGDQAGRQAAWHAAEVILPIMHDDWQIKFMFLPEGQDPDSLIRKIGQNKFAKDIAQAKTLTDFFFTHIKSQINLQHLDGRARLANLAMNHINTVTASITKELLLQKLSELTRINIERLNLLSEKSEPFVKQQKNYADITNNTQTKKNKLSPLKTAITLLIQHPHLVNCINEKLPNVDSPGMPLFIRLVELLKTYSKLSTTGAIIEHWRDKPEANIVAKLGSYNHIIPENGLEEEFCDSLKRLKEKSIEQSIEKLMTKASVAENLSDDEKKQLQQLLKNRLN